MKLEMKERCFLISPTACPSLGSAPNLQVVGKRHTPIEPAKTTAH